MGVTLDAAARGMRLEASMPEGRGWFGARSLLRRRMAAGVVPPAAVLFSQAQLDASEAEVGQIIKRLRDAHQRAAELETKIVDPPPTRTSPERLRKAMLMAPVQRAETARMALELQREVMRHRSFFSKVSDLFVTSPEKQDLLDRRAEKAAADLALREMRAWARSPEGKGQLQADADAKNHKAAEQSQYRLALIEARTEAVQVGRSLHRLGVSADQAMRDPGTKARAAEWARWGMVAATAGKGLREAAEARLVPMEMSQSLARWEPVAAIRPDLHAALLAAAGEPVERGPALGPLQDVLSQSPTKAAALKDYAKEIQGGTRREGGAVPGPGGQEGQGAGGRQAPDLHPKGAPEGPRQEGEQPPRTEAGTVPPKLVHGQEVRPSTPRKLAVGPHPVKGRDQGPVKPYVARPPQGPRNMPTATPARRRSPQNGPRR